AHRESLGALQRPRGPARQGKIWSAADVHRADDFTNLGPAPAQGGAGFSERSPGPTPFSGNEAEEKVLGPHLAVPKLPRLLLGPGDRRTRIAAEPVEHKPESRPRRIFLERRAPHEAWVLSA